MRRATLAAALYEKRRRRAASNVLDFTLATCPRYRPGWFHQEVAAELDRFLADVEAGRRPRLILTAPPQHGKSELVSRRLPAYALGRNPELRIIATSHTAELAERFSTEVQRTVDSEDYHYLFPDTRIVGQFAKLGEATRHAGLWEVVGHRGVYRACGVGGAITGMGADILIVDDPVKDDAEASSQIARNRTWDWFTSVAYTRMSEGGGIIVMMTRWDEDDLVGRLLAAQTGGGGDQWTVINFPAIAEQDEPHRRVGEPLSKERFSLDSLLAIQRMMGSYKWAALYQQRPAPVEGGIIKRAWIRYYRALPDAFDQMIQSWDCSYKDGAGCDYVAGHVWARKEGKFFLLDRVHARMDCPATMAAISSLSAKWPAATAKLVEDKANGPAVIAMLRDHLPGLMPVNPEGGKHSRMSAVSPLFEAGNVYVPDPAIAPWTDDVVAEWTSFPGAAHDDDCDAMSQALLRLRLGTGSTCPFKFGAVDRPEEALWDKAMRGTLTLEEFDRLK